MKINLFYREKYLKKIRPFYHSDIVKVITGIRRCGKSCIMRMVMEELLREGVDANRILYLPLDRRGFKSITTPEQLEERIEEMSPNDDEGCFLFIDEVQNVRGFEKVVLAYQEEGWSVFLTGSNSYLLSDEISTKLTGRYINFETYTLDFAEFLGMKRHLGLRVKDAMDEFEEYLRYGGFPKSLEFPEPAARLSYVNAVIEEIFAKDVRKRKKIKHLSVFDRVKTFLIANYGQTFSFTGVLHHFRDVEKIAMNERTLRNYVDVLKKAKIVYECPRYDCHSKRSLRGEQKFYLADPSIFFAQTPEAVVNYGPALENIVFLSLLGKGEKASIGLIGKWECDFISSDPSMRLTYIQVTRYLTEDNKEREYRPFREIRDSFPRLLLSMDRLLDQQEGVPHQNIVDYLLGA